MRPSRSLSGHDGEVEVFGVDEVVVGVVAADDLDPPDVAGEGVVDRGVVVGHRGAGVAADVVGLVEVERGDVGPLDATGRHLGAVDVEGGGGALADAAAVVGELDADLVLAGGERNG